MDIAKARHSLPVPRHDALRGGVSIDGFDLAQLTRDLQALDQEH